jgi:hypothetical protein
MDRFIEGPDIGIIALTFALAMLLAWGVGTWMGHRLRSEGNTKPSKFDDASRALLGLVLAFTFGVSFSKYDQRRIAVVADGNAIGDFYTCAALLKDPTRTKLQTVIWKYAELRLDLARKQISSSDLEGAAVRFEQMHSQMTELVRQALSDGTPIAASLTNTLNAVTSNQAARLDAFRGRLPTSIVMLLFVNAIITALLIGREQGSGGNSEVAGTLCFILLVSIAIYVTLDLNQPQLGLIRVSQEPIERLLSSMPK